VSFAPKVNVVTLTVDNFASNSDVVPPAGAAMMGVVAALIAVTPLATVRIEGFTDNRGTVADNLDLGGRRAENATADLAALGVAPGRIQLEPRGETAFVAPNTTEANRALNRRVVFTVTRPGP
jgi:outer membrane protein OmpA-like peptidoglycan-associated protein